LNDQLHPLFKQIVNEFDQRIHILAKIDERLTAAKVKELDEDARVSLFLDLREDFPKVPTEMLEMLCLEALSWEEAMAKKIYMMGWPNNLRGPMAESNKKFYEKLKSEMRKPPMSMIRPPFDLTSKRTWVVVENDPDRPEPLLIYLDSGQTVLIIVDVGQDVTDDDRKFAARLCELQNSKLRQEAPDVSHPRW
jgi:hypothetical protein